MRTRIRSGILGVAAAAVLILAACGGGDGGGGIGTDEQYIDDLCGAFAGFSKDMEGLFADMSGETDQQKVTDAFVGPFEDFVNELKKARPPADVRPYHDELVSSMEQTVRAIKEGDMDVLQNDPIVSDPPADIQARLEKVAQNNKTCQEADFTFGG